MLNDMNIIDERKSEVTPTMVVDSHILLKVYLNKLKLILLVTLAALIIAVIFVKIQVVPSWKANCYIIRAPKNMSTPVEMPYLYQTFDINTILETVRTRDVLTDVIQKLELDV
ncbi:MAG: Wzz/FepE/Etk N-terminal domain-containing protein, partial [Candidatus Cloacimonetes bacterium]|nr:Wzz/FepE/Etk N-terminal domain-containing protein [Candidatus Cloacimonadota bacterium]